MNGARNLGGTAAKLGNRSRFGPPACRHTFGLARQPVAAAETVHYQAHGLVADEIYQVQEGTEPGNGSVSPVKR